MDIKFDWDDISIVPSTLSDISSRSEIEINNLPIFTAPMDMVIDENNINKFYKNNINICLPRNIKYDVVKDQNYFYSYGLDEITSIIANNDILPNKVLIDIANGHMKKLYDISKVIKEKYKYVQLMIGNIANPEAYREYCKIGVDLIRVGIGGGSVCTTSANVSIHYPMASLISECYEISKEFENPTKIVADGGFRNYSDIIKALALGADFVMLGSILNKCLESCSDTYEIENDILVKVIEDPIIKFNNKVELYKYYRGMSTKEVQKTWNRKELKTGEGISKYNKVEYTIDGWCENFIDYLKSAMSYSNSKNLSEFIGKAKWVYISQNSFKRFNK